MAKLVSMILSSQISPCQLPAFFGCISVLFCGLLFVIIVICHQNYHHLNHLFSVILSNVVFDVVNKGTFGAQIWVRGVEVLRAMPESKGSRLGSPDSSSLRYLAPLAVIRCPSNTTVHTRVPTTFAFSLSQTYTPRWNSCSLSLVYPRLKTFSNLTKSGLQTSPCTLGSAPETLHLGVGEA